MGATAGETARLIPADKQRRLSVWQLISTTFIFFPIWFHSTVFSVIIVPSQVNHYTGNNSKGVGLGVANTVMGVAGVLLGPLIGYLSDRTKVARARRRVWIVPAVLLNCAVGVALPFCPSLSLYSALLFLDVATFLAMFNNSSALIPDCVPREQSGIASGYMQGFMMIGGFGASVLGLFTSDLGTFIPAAYQLNVYSIEIGLLLLSLPVLALFVREPAVPIVPSDSKEEKRSFLETARVFWTKQFVLIIVVTSLYQGVANSALQNYFQYYATDILQLPLTVAYGYTLKNPEAAASLFNVANLLGSVLAAVPVGLLADRLPRRPILIIAILSQALVGVAMMVSRNILVIVLANVLYGAGLSASGTVTFAVVTEYLAHAESKASGVIRFDADRAALESNNGAGAALFTMAQSAPYLITPFLNGLALDYFNRRGQIVYGYDTIYTAAIVALVIGAALVPWLRCKYHHEDPPTPYEPATVLVHPTALN